MGRRGKNKYKKRIMLMQSVAMTRVPELMELAFNTYDSDPILANRYVQHVREISMAAKVRIPQYYKRYICHGCKKLLVPGKNMRFRIKTRKRYGSYLVVSCLDCNHITRYIYKGKAYRYNKNNNNQ